MLRRKGLVGWKSYPHLPSLGHLIWDKPFDAATFSEETWARTVPGLSKNWGQVDMPKVRASSWGKTIQAPAQIPKVRAS